MKDIPNIIIKSCKWSFAVISGASTIAGLLGYTIRDISKNFKLWHCILILFFIFFLLSFVFYLVFKKLQHKAYKTSVNGKSVVIKVGDIFTENGWKVIPFSERFDTEVDDRIVAHNTLNGQMIDNYVKNQEDLKQTIIAAEYDMKSNLKPRTVKGRKIYPLGRLIPFNDFLMLAFSHFDENDTAYLDISEYEQMLFSMWNEMRNVYAAKHIVLPLLGGGVTTINGFQEKNYTGLMKCMLCTLRNSGFQPDQGITIILTESTIEKIDMNTIREEF